MASIVTTSVGLSALDYKIEDLKTKKGKITKEQIDALASGSEKTLLEHLFKNQKYLGDGSNVDNYIEYDEIIKFLSFVDTDENGRVTEREVRTWIDANVAVGGHANDKVFGDNNKEVMETLKSLFETLAKSAPTETKKTTTTTKASSECSTTSTSAKADDCVSETTTVAAKKETVKTSTESTDLLDQLEIDVNDFSIIAEEVWKNAHGSLDGFTAEVVQNTFNLLDTNRNGKLSQTELAKYKAATGFTSLTVDDSRRVQSSTVTSNDTTSDSTDQMSSDNLDIEEFLSVMRGTYIGMNGTLTGFDEAAARDNFIYLDNDENNLLDPTEYESFILGLSLKYDMSTQN